MLQARSNGGRQAGQAPPVARVPEADKRPGVCYAVTEDGLELPVVDVTHPAFALDPSPSELEALATASVHGMRRSARMPAFLLRFIARGSRLMRESMAAAGSGVSGMGTYLLKLGADNLGSSWASRLDRQLAAAISPVSLRLRLRDTARLLAGTIPAALERTTDPHVALLNLGGGTAADSWNALLLLRRERPEALAGRDLTVVVLDTDTASPAFGARAVAALTAAGAPLSGTNAGVRHVAHDWQETATLRALLRGGGLGGTPIAVSSEGGLFEYGSDQEIADNLAVLRAELPPGTAFVGDVVRDGELARTICDVGHLRLRRFTRDDFAALAARAGWRLEREVVSSPLYLVFALAAY